MSTQWRSSGFGATGLDYGPLGFVMDRLGVPLSRRDEVFEQVRILEDAALGTMRMTADRERERQGRTRNGRRG